MSRPSIKLLIRDQPRRSFALATDQHALVLKGAPGPNDLSAIPVRNASQTSLAGPASGAPRCIAEFVAASAVDWDEYRPLGFKEIYGTLGLIAINGEVFLCVVNSATQAAEIRPGEVVQRINTVEFHCLTSSKYDNVLNDQINPWPTDDVDEEGLDLGHPRLEGQPEHPCLALKKLLSSGTFFYSADFDLTRRLQKRVTDQQPSIAIDSLDAGFLWNSFMVQPLVDFRSRLSPGEKAGLDASRILTSAIRGYCYTVTVPWSSAPLRNGTSGMPSSLTIVSRLSCLRAGTRFNARGMDDDGNVANFVETETVFWSATGTCFSYVQVRGSVPIFWEQASGLLPGQQKISITRSPEATQAAFDKHFEKLDQSYTAVHVINLLSAEKSSEAELSSRYRLHIKNSSLNPSRKGSSSGFDLLKFTEYDFNAETRGPNGYEAASAIQHYVNQSADDSFGYFLSDEREGQIHRIQQGVFRTNCLDCLDRTNLIQTILSQIALDALFSEEPEPPTPDFWARHRTLWADNGDTLSRIYAGTGALKSSFTRHGKMSLGGVLSDARKSATRMYINNFADKGRQNTIDLLLGRLVGQNAVHLYDPIKDYVQAELRRRADEYTTTKKIHILVGTLNLNGKDRGMREDLRSWLCPEVDESQRNPEIVAVGFQEIVELSPQQIMSTDHNVREAWERAVKATLNDNAVNHGEEEYVLLRGSQLVGASLSIFVRASFLDYIKDVEGSVKKTGLSGMAGNKGAVAIRMEVANTSLCFVTAHLAAGFANYDERNRDYKTIADGLRFQRNRTIDDHETVIWFGDFNYRIGLSNERARHLIKVGDLETLHDNDQLNDQMTHGQVFPFYSESPITFPPTYKFQIGTDEYDLSEKARVPAWTDRVLRKGENLRQINYSNAQLRFSDHRPVYATFSCEILVVDDQHKNALRLELSRQRKDTGTFLDLEDADTDVLSDIKPIADGLPPPSSANGKWLLENSMPARSTLNPPGPNYMPNPNRRSNPFAPTEDPDWVKVEKSPAPPPPRRSGVTASQRNPPLPRRELPREVKSDAPTIPRVTPPRFTSPNLIDRRPVLPARPPMAGSNVLPPPSKVELGLAAQPAPPVARKILPPPRPSSVVEPSLESPTIIRKGPPPRPKKPSALASSPVLPLSRVSSIGTLPPADRERSETPPAAPPPRRSRAAVPGPPDPTPASATPPAFPPPPTNSKPRIPLATKPLIAAPAGQSARPPLPPRLSAGGGGALDSAPVDLMMDERDDGIDGLRDWEVLKPVY